MLFRSPGCRTVDHLVILSGQRTRGNRQPPDCRHRTRAIHRGERCWWHGCI